MHRVGGLAAGIYPCVPLKHELCLLHQDADTAGKVTSLMRVPVRWKERSALHHSTLKAFREELGDDWFIEVLERAVDRCC